MIDALVSGLIYGTPNQRAGQDGKPFFTAKVRAPSVGGDTLMINVITFSRETGAALLALDDGDSVALSGSLTPKVWTDKQGLVRPACDMVAHSILTAYDIDSKRKAMEPTGSDILE